MNRRKFTPTERAYIEQRAKGCCEYCQTMLDYSPETFQIEHIFPFSQGGTNELFNLALSCGGCNRRKRNRTTAIDFLTGEAVLLFNPRLDLWRSHFNWSADFSKIEGKTPVGRATIDALALNRTGLINLRKALAAFGVHPPTVD